MQPLISVIIPVYNVAPYLRRCVDSLLAQTFRDFELILVDDGSTDGSGDISDEYAKLGIEHSNLSGEHRDPSVAIQVRVIHQPNAGVSTARNRGIEAAEGQFISFVDADDWVEPTFLQAFADELEKHPDVDCVLQGFVDHEGIAQTESYAYYADKYSLCSELYRLEKKKLIGYVWNKLFRRALVIENQLRFDLHIPIGEDLLFCMIFFTLCERTSIIENIGYRYFFSGHKNYTFQQLNNRLDTFYRCIFQQQTIPSEVVEAFLFNEYRFALYILHRLYAERPPRQIRIDYLIKIKSRGKVFRGRTDYKLESPYCWLSAMVQYLPHLLCDLLLQFIFPERKA